MSDFPLNCSSSIDNKSTDFIERRPKQRQLSGIHRSGITDSLENIEISRPSRVKIRQTVAYNNKLILHTEPRKKPKKPLKITMKNASKHFSDITSTLDGKIKILKKKVKTTLTSLKKKEIKKKYYEKALISFDNIVSEMNYRLAHLTTEKGYSLLNFFYKHGVPVGRRCVLSKNERLIAKELKSSVESIEYLNEVQRIKLTNLLLLAREFQAGIDILYSKQSSSLKPAKLDEFLSEEWSQINEIYSESSKIAKSKQEILSNTNIIASRTVEIDDSIQNFTQALLKILQKTCKILIRQQKQ